MNCKKKNMPYTYKKIGDKYTVYKKETGEKVGSTEGTKEALEKYLGALHANTNENNLNLESLRDKVNKLLREVIIDKHAEQRLKERLLSQNGYEVGFEETPMNYKKVGTYFIPQNIIDSILSKIDILKTKSFPKIKEYGIKLEEIPIDLNKISFANNAFAIVVNCSFFSVNKFNVLWYAVSINFLTSSSITFAVSSEIHSHIYYNKFDIF